MSSKKLDQICNEIKEQWDVLFNIFEQMNSLTNISNNSYIVKKHKEWLLKIQTNLGLTITAHNIEFMASIDKMHEVFFFSN